MRGLTGIPHIHLVIQIIPAPVLFLSSYPDVIEARDRGLNAAGRGSGIDAELSAHIRVLQAVT